MKFSLGQIVVTRTAAEALERWGQPAEALLERHQSGDWGDLSDEQRQVNDEALERQLNLLSVYRAPSGLPLNVFTNAERSLTMVHLGLQSPATAEQTS